MLKNRHADTDCENSNGENANSQPNSTAELLETAISTNSTNGIRENGTAINSMENNNHVDESIEESSVIIEPAQDAESCENLNSTPACENETLQVNLEELTEEMETTLDETSSQDDGMISSNASTNGSVLSVNQAIHDQPAAPEIDQPEVADFLDMDFDVEPTSTDDEDSGSNDKKEKKELIPVKKDIGTSTKPKNTNGYSNFQEDIEDSDLDQPSTSYGTGASSAVFKNASESSICIQGCRACNPTSGRNQRSAVVGNIIGELQSINGPGSFHTPRAPQNRPLFRRSPQDGPSQNVNIGGPNGLGLARSAYVGFPLRRVGNGSLENGQRSDDDGTFRIWTIEEANAMQATQIGPSACGATALINVFRGLGLDPSGSDFARSVPTRLRANDGSVAEYLLSRSTAGTDAEDLIEAANRLSGSRVLGRFFPMRDGTIVTEEHEELFGRWLLEWLKRGAIPVLTLNMQRGLLPTEPTPDAWHHQMVFGVCVNVGYVYLTNPLEIVPLWFLKHALCSPSILLVKTDDIRQRWHGRSTDLSPLLVASRSEQPNDSRPVRPTLWTEMNMLGQVARALRQASQSEITSNTEPILTHVAIPARYRSGVTLYALANTETWTSIRDHPNLDDTIRNSHLTTRNSPCRDMDWDSEVRESSATIPVANGDHASHDHGDSSDQVPNSVSEDTADQENGDSQSCNLM